MGNVCYTQYRIEGPTEEIKALALKINQDMFKSRKQDGCRQLLYGWNTMKWVEPEDIRPMNDGWSVLSFEAPSKWSPWWESWLAYAQETVPQAVLYYYTEEFGCGVCESNDVWQKYFRFGYVTVLHTSEKTPKKIIEAFAKGGVYRHREDQCCEYFKYWDRRSFRAALLDFVPYRRRYNSELIEAMDDLMEREDWYYKLGTNLGIYQVKRIEPQKKSPCEHCEKWNKLWNENVDLSDRMYRLQSLIDKHQWRSRKTIMELAD